MSSFPQIFDPMAYRHIFIIKGGPGTGKSRFMNEIAADAEQNGHRVRYYYCSSDTASLDAITIPSRGIAVLDGTAPHLTDPVYPGAVRCGAVPSSTAIPRDGIVIASSDAVSDEQ